MQNKNASKQSVKVTMLVGVTPLTSTPLRVSSEQRAYCMYLVCPSNHESTICTSHMPPKSDGTQILWCRFCIIRSICPLPSGCQSLPLGMSDAPLSHPPWISADSHLIPSRSDMTNRKGQWAWVAWPCKNSWQTNLSSIKYSKKFLSIECSRLVINW